jgi:hypothetical protein|tara:strand:+ start:530 stop:775 length:246 start_codon:yes stop_codon:yes gene_type:complete
MAEIKRYGKLKEEERLEDVIKSRDIVQEILNFGVSQRQIAKIIQLLALELEDRDILNRVSSAINPLLEEETNKDSSNVILT